MVFLVALLIKCLITMSVTLSVHKQKYEVLVKWKRIVIAKVN